MRAQFAVEIHHDVLGRAERVLRGQRLRDAVLDILGGNSAAGARHHHFAEVAGVEPDQRMGAHRLDHGVGRHRAGGAEIGRAENRHFGDDAGMIDQIADAHDIAGDGGFGLSFGRS